MRHTIDLAFSRSDGDMSLASGGLRSTTMGGAGRMRSAARLNGQGMELALLGTLLAAASCVLFVNEMSDGRSALSYAVLAWLFVAATMLYCGHLYLDRR